MKKIYIYDCETINYFTIIFIDRDSDEKRTFVIGEDIDNRKELFEFFDNKVLGMIGYNNLHFDSQIIEYLYRNPNCTALEIQTYASLIINTKDRKSDVPEWKLRLPQLDLFRALSLSTKSKRTSLKWCEFMLDLENIEDLDFSVQHSLEDILYYNENDVIATKTLYHKYKHEIDLRMFITKTDGVNVMNSTEPDIVKKLFGKHLSDAMGIHLSELRNMGTNRDIVHVKDIIFPYINFRTEKFQKLLEKFRTLSLSVTDKFEEIIRHQGIDIVFGLGGLHASPNNKIICSTDICDIESADVISFYPNLMIRNGQCPKHLPKDIFLNLYEGMFNERRNTPKSNPKNYILKICLNSLYGLTNDEFSFVRDRAVTLSICINGQLSLMMLIEELLFQIPDSTLVMINTDGFEILIPKEHKHLYNSICKQWETLTKLELEFVNYQKMIISDVNNYISIDNKGKTKLKGKFEFENIPLHKNKSHSIIPKAIYEYFVNNIPVEQTILNHKNIFDFCAGVKASLSEKKGKSHYELHTIEGSNLVITKLSKIVRYYISTTGQTLLKKYENGDVAQVEAPTVSGKFKKYWKVCHFNKSFKVNDFKDYNINYDYYILHANMQIRAIEGITNQLEMF